MKTMLIALATSALLSSCKKETAATSEQYSYLDYASSDAHLVPSAARDERYRTMIRNVFRESLGSNVVIGAIVLPSFDRERVVGIRHDASKSIAFSLEASIPVSDVRTYELYSEDLNAASWPKEERDRRYPNGPPALEEIGLRRREATISSSDENRVVGIWLGALSATRRAEPKQAKGGKDGVRYEFFAQPGGPGGKFGMTWSPSEGTRMAALVAVAEALEQFVKATDQESNSMLGRLRSAMDDYARGAR